MTSLETRRLRIAPLTLADAPAVQELITEKISRWTGPVPWPHELQHAEWWLGNTPPEKRLGMFLEGVPVGAISIPAVDGDEVGFWINEKYEGRGLVTEAATAVIDFAFSVKKLSYLESPVHRDNLASRRVHEKLKFKLVGEADHFWRNKQAKVPCVIYRLTKQDWDS